MFFISMNEQYKYFSNLIVAKIKHNAQKAQISEIITYSF